MTNKTLNILAAAVAVLISGCAGDKPCSTVLGHQQIGSSPDYAVVKWDNVEDHVVTVHGFTDDMTACADIAAAMNYSACRETRGAGCLEPYSCRLILPSGEAGGKKIRAQFAH